MGFSFLLLLGYVCFCFVLFFFLFFLSVCVFFYINRSIVKCLVKHNKKCWCRKDREEACLYKVGEKTDPRSVTILLSHSCVLFCLLRLWFCFGNLCFVFAGNLFVLLCLLIHFLFILFAGNLFCFILFAVTLLLLFLNSFICW